MTDQDRTVRAELLAELRAERDRLRGAVVKLEEEVERLQVRVVDAQRLLLGLALVLMLAAGSARAAGGGEGVYLCEACFDSLVAEEE